MPGVIPGDTSGAMPSSKDNNAIDLRQIARAFAAYHKEIFALESENAWLRGIIWDFVGSTPEQIDPNGPPKKL